MRQRRGQSFSEGSIGAGVDLVAACDIRVCSADAFFQIAEIDVGITAAWPAAPPDYSDYAAREIEVGSVHLDLYVRWYAFDVHARAITEGMKLAAAQALAALVGDDLAEDMIIPSPFDPRVGPAVAAAVAAAARAEGVARL